VTTRGPNVEAPFLDQINMLLCPPNDPQAIAKAIDSLIKNQALRARLGVGALQLAEEWFSWEKAVQQLMRALSSQLPKPSLNDGSPSPAASAVCERRMLEQGPLEP
jgi:glycosyltransferase involved in cell wall biosynthesis